MIGGIAIVIAAGIAWLFARRARVPYPIALVSAGVVLRILAGRFDVLAPPLRLSPPLLLNLILPPLLFEGAHALRARDLRQPAPLIGLLAGPGVLVGGTIAAALTWAALRAVGDAIPWSTALVFAAVTSATDPVAVLAVLRSAKAAPSLRVVLDSESLLNDAMAVLVLGVVVEFVAGGSPRWGLVLLGALWKVVAGLGVGIAIGAVASWVSMRAAGAPRVFILIVLSVAAAYGANLAASLIGASSILAVIAAGFVWGHRNTEPPREVERFWAATAIAVNLVTFVLIGIELDPTRIGRHALAVVLAWGALLVARSVFVAGSMPAARGALAGRSTSRMLVFGGIRGALSMVLALGLPPSSPRRDMVIDLTLGIVPLTLAQGFFVAFFSRPGTAGLPGGGMVARDGENT
jgi:CPA1 family monovalent cation:H+ antiporter